MRSPAIRAAAMTLLLFATAAPVAGQSVLLRLNPAEGLESRYVMDMVTHMDSPMMSSDEPFMIMQVYTTQRVLGVDGDVVEYEVTTDSTDVSSPAMPMIEQQMPDQSGQVQRMKMDTRGRMVGFELDDEAMEEEVQQFMGQMGGMGLQLPENQVSPGESWNANIDFDAPGMPGGAAMTMEMQMSYTLTDVSSAGGSQFATITFEGPIVMSGSGAGVGMDATGTNSGTLVFDVTLGRIASSEMELTLDMNAGGMQLSMNQSMSMVLIN